MRGDRSRGFDADQSRVPMIAVGLLSGAALAYEILLTRLFSIIQWQQFAWLVISLALLGIGASGSLLALFGKRFLNNFSSVFSVNAALFGMTSVAFFLFAQALPFNPLEIAWDPYQLIYLSATYLLLAVPFFCAANAIGLALWRHRYRLHGIYAADLMGAGIGALGIVLLLFWFPAERSLTIIGALGIIAAGISLHETRVAKRIHTTVFWVLALGILLLPDSWIELRLSPYKGLSQALETTGSHLEAQQSSPLGLISVVSNDLVPIRFAPGMSLSANTRPPPQLGLYVDGEPIGAITRFNGEQHGLAYLDQLTSALAYHLTDKPGVVVLGSGAGMDVLQAIYHRAKHIDAVELNPQIVRIVNDEFGAFSGHLFDRNDVTMHIAEARGFMTATDKRWNLIQLSLIDAFSATSSGLYAQNESYLYTKEALQTYLSRLEQDGYLSITRWLRIPPRDSLKLFATAIDVLKAMGYSDPDRRIAMIRGWKTTTLILKNGLLTNRDISAIKQFSDDRSFDVAYFPGMRRDDANQYNTIPEPLIFDGATALLNEERDDFIRDYKFAITPSTDDAPWFFRFTKWQTLPELLSLRAGGGFAQIEWGFIVLVASLVQAIVASIVLIILPLFLNERTQEASHSIPDGLRSRVLIYFLTIGFAFLFMEIAMIQKFLLFLHHPLYAVAVVLAGLLVFAGAGSAWSNKWEYMSSKQQQTTILYIALSIIALAVTYLFMLPSLSGWLSAMPDILRILFGIALLSPIAFLMGMPFPLALSCLARSAPTLVPWAWAINGCASVVGAILATLLAMEYGFSLVIMTAALLYFVAAMSFPGQDRFNESNAA